MSNPLFAAFCLARSIHPDHGARLGVTAPRALGGAVIRNRIKRRLREAFRKHRADFAGQLKQWDVVLNPRRSAIEASFEEIERALMKVIARCNAEASK